MTEDDAPGAYQTRRRSFLRASTATVLGAGAMAGAGVGVVRALDHDGGTLGQQLTLQSGGNGLGELERPLRDLGLAAERPGEWVTPALATDPVTMIGFTWRRSARTRSTEPVIHVRLRTQGRWGLWRPVPVLHDLPDPDSEEGGGRLGTAPLLVQPTDGLQVRVAKALPRDLRLTLIHAAELPGDARAAARTGRPVFSKGIAQPVIHSRAEWGANESWRSGSPSYISTIQQVHIHHTATSNGYAAADVPATLRSMYKYHTKSLGWSDIGYNFLVDAYGTIWEGRYGGVDRAVKGAHTLGFNDTSTGFSVIGNFETTQPTPQIISSLSALAGWKLSMYGGDPNGVVAVTSTGSDKFSSGRVVTLPVIDGHRDTNDTACPGTNLYNQIPAVRAGTAGVITAATLKIKKPFTLSGYAVVGSALTVGGGKFKPGTAAVSYQWTRAGVPIDGAVAASYTATEADVALELGCVVTGSVAGAAPVQQTVAAGVPTSSVPTLAVRTQRKPGGKAIIHLDVTAPGIPEPDGQVTIKVGSRSRTVAVTKGKAVVRILGLKPGRYRVRCQYAGGTLVAAGKAKDWVRIPGKA